MFQSYFKEKIPNGVFLELGCFKVEQKIFFFVNIFLSLVQTRLSRNGTTLGRKCFYTVLNFGHLAI